MDAGPVWASVNFPMRAARKSSLYRNEVTEAAVTSVLQAIDRYEMGKFIPVHLHESRSDAHGKWQPLVQQSDRRIDWLADDTQTVLRKIHSADGSPGIEDALLGVACRLYDACEEDSLRGVPGEIIARRHGAVCRATRDGAIWIGHVKKIVPGEKTFKLPAVVALQDKLGAVPEVTVPLDVPPARLTYKDIWYEEKAGVGYLHFDFYNGAMSTGQCQRLREAYLQACQRPTRVIVLMGGPDFWSNGIHLNCIEAADSPADESWRNINAMDDLAQAIIKTDSQLTIAALQGNTAAGGVFLALAADRLYARNGVVLNPHYKNMGNLYGSEYWSYLLPKRMGEQGREIMGNRLPLGASAAKRAGLIDDCFGGSVNEFVAMIKSVAETLARDPSYETLLEAKRRRRVQDESVKSLETYRAEELERLKLNFYGFDPSYHVARYNFVFRVPHSWTPLHLARHRQRIKNAKPSDADASSRQDALISKSAPGM